MYHHHIQLPASRPLNSHLFPFTTVETIFPRKRSIVNMIVKSSDLDNGEGKPTRSVDVVS